MAQASYLERPVEQHTADIEPAVDIIQHLCFSLRIIMGLSTPLSNRKNR
jgi:hypothetical protein